MNKPIFQFGNVVVVDDDQIGVICKTWGPGSLKKYYAYEVYVRSYNSIQEYREDNIKHFVYNKELLNDEMDSY